MTARPYLAPLVPASGDVIRLVTAVSAVLLYQLATYWLPVLPGRLSWRSLPHRGYV